MPEETNNPVMANDMQLLHARSMARKIKEQGFAITNDLSFFEHIDINEPNFPLVNVQEHFDKTIPFILRRIERIISDMRSGLNERN